MHWVLWLLLIYVVIGLAMFGAGKLLNPKAKLPPFTFIVVVLGWLPLLAVNVYEAFKPRRF